MTKYPFGRHLRAAELLRFLVKRSKKEDCRMHCVHMAVGRDFFIVAIGIFILTSCASPTEASKKSTTNEVAECIQGLYGVVLPNSSHAATLRAGGCANLTSYVPYATNFSNVTSVNICGSLCGSCYGGVFHNLLFGVKHSSCFCLLPSVSPGPLANKQAQDYTNQHSSYFSCPNTSETDCSFCMDLFSIGLVCAPLDGVSSSCEKGCRVVGRCCAPLLPGEESVDELSYVVFRYVVLAIAFALVVKIALVLFFRKVRSLSEEGKHKGKLRDTAEAESLSEALLCGIDVDDGQGEEPFSRAPANGSQEFLQCCVCLESLAPASGARVLSCRHKLHHHCLREYLTYQLRRHSDLTCPVCSAAVLSPGTRRTAPRLDAFV